MRCTAPSAAPSSATLPSTSTYAITACAITAWLMVLTSHVCAQESKQPLPESRQRPVAAGENGGKETLDIAQKLIDKLDQRKGAAGTKVWAGVDAPAGSLPKQPTVGGDLMILDMGPLLARLVNPDAYLTEELALLARADCAQTIAASIRAFCVPRLGPKHEVKVVGGRHLAVTALKKQHAWVSDFLIKQMWPTRPELGLTCEVFMLDYKVLKDFGLVQNPKVLSAAEIKAIRGLDRTANAEFKVRDLTKFSTSNLDGFDEKSGHRVAYISDFEITFDDESGSAIGDPVVSTVRLGSSFSGHAVALDDDLVGVDCEFILTRVDLPIPSHEIKLPDLKAKATIQMPRADVVRIEASVTLEPGKLAAFPGPRIRGKYPLVVISAVIQ